MSTFDDTASMLLVTALKKYICLLCKYSTFQSYALKLFSSATQRMLSNTIFNWIQISSVADKCFNYMSKLTKCIRANC